MDEERIIWDMPDALRETHHISKIIVYPRPPSLTGIHRSTLSSQRYKTWGNILKTAGGKINIKILRVSSFRRSDLVPALLGPTKPKRSKTWHCPYKKKSTLWCRFKWVQHTPVGIWKIWAMTIWKWSASNWLRKSVRLASLALDWWDYQNSNPLSVIKPSNLIVEVRSRNKPRPSPVKQKYAEDRIRGAHTRRLPEERYQDISAHGQN